MSQVYNGSLIRVILNVNSEYSKFHLQAHAYRESSHRFMPIKSHLSTLPVESPPYVTIDEISIFQSRVILNLPE